MSDITDNSKILNDIRAYLRISVAAASKAVASSVIDMQEKAQVYQKLGENKSQVTIVQETGIPQPTVSRWINDFVEAGLVTEPNEFSSEYRALFSLRELGINATELGKRKARQQWIAKPQEGTTDGAKEEKA